MRKVKVLRGKEASQTKRALDIGDIAPVVLENFETLTNPKFKPKLELIEGDPHTPPTMNTNTDQNIKTDGEDGNRPDVGDITSKAPEYENAPDVAPEDIPHENEHVKQGQKVAEKPDFLKTDEEKAEEEDENSDSDTDEGNSVEASIERLKREYASRYSLAAQLFDIRKQAGVEEEINRYNFVNTKAESTEINTLEAQIADGTAYLNQIQASRPQAETKVAGITLPGGFSGAAARSDSPFEDDLEAVVMGG